MLAMSCRAIAWLVICLLRAISWHVKNGYTWQPLRRVGWHIEFQKVARSCFWRTAWLTHGCGCLAYSRQCRHIACIKAR